MILPLPVRQAISRLEDSDFEAFAVGGCVRDSLLGISPLDWDITTSARPDEIADVFKDFKVIPTGIKHGTVTVIISGLHLEITTYRIDGVYEDSRHPVQVTFSQSIAEDLSRRDFTINAMAYSPRSGITDPFHGIEDLRKKIIRAVGIPKNRFFEDALRIMRALRFAAVLNFEIDYETSMAMLQSKHLLKNVAAERVGSELNKILLSSSPEIIMEKYFSILSEKLFGTDIYFHSQGSSFIVDFSPLKRTVPDLAVRISAFIICAANALSISPDTLSESFFSNMRYDRHTRREVTEIIGIINLKLSDDRIFLRRLISKKGVSTVQKLVEVQKALNSSGNSDDFSAIALTLEKIVLKKDCCSLRNLAINGTDLAKAFSLQNEKIGYALTFLLEAVIEDKCKNTKASLMEYYKKMSSH